MGYKKRDDRDIRRYICGDNGMESTVFCHLPSEGEYKTVCVCLHPSVAMAIRDSLQAEWEAHGRMGTMPHFRYTHLATVINQGYVTQEVQPPRWHAVYLTYQGRTRLIAAFDDYLDAAQHANRMAFTTVIPIEAGDGVLQVPLTTVTDND